jgi:hypothetical protein
VKLPADYLILLEKMRLETGRVIRPVPDHAVVYPPPGFVQWPFCEVGNGDVYGYYWPLGKEDSDPIVVATSHDYSTLTPISSSIEALARIGNCPELASVLARGEYPSELSNDPEDDVSSTVNFEEKLALDDRSPFFLVANADAAVDRNELERAESLYLRAVEVLPEYTAAHFGLVALYRRTRRQDDCIRSMLVKIRSLLCFGGASFWSDTALPTRPVNRQDYRRKCLLG